MVNRGFVATGMMVIAAISVLIYCNKEDEPAAPESVIGVWAGAAGRLGGGGTGLDTNPTSGAITNRLDSFGIVLTITGNGFSIVRGNKIWGSSLYARDSSREAGTWDSAGNVITFTPDTLHDSCFQYGSCQDPPSGWCQCLGFNSGPNYCDCFPPFSLTIDIDGNIWNSAVIPNTKLAGQNDTMRLTRP